MLVQSRDFLTELHDRVDQLIARAKIVAAKLGDSKLNISASEKSWSSGQIFEHMIIANNFYLPAMRAALEGAEAGAGEVKHSLLGRLIMKGAGPEGNVPAPKKMHPRRGPYTQEVVERWLDQHKEILALLDRAKSVDVAGTPMRNPLLPLFKMNLADAFAIVTLHGERHIGQIEELAKRL